MLQVGESRTCVIEGTSKKPGNIEEDFYCYGAYGKSIKRSLILSFMMVAQFAIPMLETSKTEMNFRMDVGSDLTTSFLRGKRNVHVSQVTLEWHLFFFRCNNRKEQIEIFGVRGRFGG